MLNAIVRDFRNGVVDEEKIRKAQMNPFKEFRLDTAVGVRPSVLKYKMKIDDSYLKRVCEDVYASPFTKKRVGREWRPRNESAIRSKQSEEDLWATFEDIRPLNDVCTKWCTNKYFPDAFARVNMIANTIRLYDRLSTVNRFSKANIIFKGGVMIRLVLLEFLNDFPLEARMSATQYMNEYKALSISDFDFEMISKDHNQNDGDVHRQTLLHYSVLLWLQREMQREMEGGKGGLLTLGWDEDKGRKELKKMLQTAMDEMEDGPFKGCKVDHVFLSDTADNSPLGYKTKSGKSNPPPRRNTLIFDCDDTRCVLPASSAFSEFGVRGVPSKSGGGKVYSTLNSYIGDGTELSRKGHLNSIFHLSRIKHAFLIYYTTRTGEKRCDRLGGEMIDLSQSHGVSKDMVRALMYKKVQQPYKEYPILGVDTADVVLRSYSVEGFLFDHMKMIHHEEELPWEIEKKDKRMVRYVCFLFAHVLSPNVDGSHSRKMNAIEKLSNFLSSIDSLLSSPPLRTGIQPVDSFAARERMSVFSSRSSKKSITNYPSALSKHISSLHKRLTAHDPSNTVLDYNIYRNMQKFILST